MDAHAVPGDLIALLRQSGLGGESVAVRPCRRGGNNRVDLVEVDGRRLVAKRYHRGPGDSRDRLDSEWRFLTYAQSLGLDCVPRPLASDAETGLALYTYVEGRSFEGSEINRDDVIAASRFVTALNDGERRGADVLVAAEACFSIADQLTVVDARVARLKAIQSDAPLDREATSRAAKLADAWSAIRNSAVESVRQAGWDISAALPAAQRCISPSDFGFHNAIRRPTNDICFIDFEYAGWDDPAKMVADFFCQPAVPVPLALYDLFLDEVAKFSRGDDNLKHRTAILLPVLRVKWCCIMLNEFLPDAARRRTFADPGVDIESRKRAQLGKIARTFPNLTE